MGGEAGGVVQDVAPASAWRVWDSVLQVGEAHRPLPHGLPSLPILGLHSSGTCLPPVELFFLGGSLGLTVPEGTGALAPRGRGPACTLGGLWMDQGVSWNLS